MLQNIALTIGPNIGMELLAILFFSSVHVHLKENKVYVPSNFNMIFGCLSMVGSQEVKGSKVLEVYKWTFALHNPVCEEHNVQVYGQILQFCYLIQLQRH